MMNKNLPIPNRWLAALCLSATALSAACNNAAAPQPVASVPGEGMAASAAAKSSGQPSTTAIDSVQNLMVPKHEGGTLKLNEFRGKILVVDFWGTWCGPCRKQAPQLAELSKKYRDKGVAVVGMSLDDQKTDQKLVNDFIKQVGINYQIAYPSRIVTDAFLKGTEDETGSPPIPQLFIFGKDGRLVDHLIGERPDKGLSYLEQVVAQQLSTN